MSSNLPLFSYFWEGPISGKKVQTFTVPKKDHEVTRVRGEKLSGIRGKRGSMDWLSNPGFMPHGHCYLWNRHWLWAQVVADGLIFLAYASIPLVLFLLVKRGGLRHYRGVVLLFAIFILGCGVTHLLHVVSMFDPWYRTQAVASLFTAGVSIVTALGLWPLLPKILSMPTPEALQNKADELAAEVLRREKAEAELRDLNANLERRVREVAEGASRLAAILNHSRDAVIAVDAQGRVRSWNRGARQLFGPAPSSDAPIETCLPPGAMPSDLRNLLDPQVGGDALDWQAVVRSPETGNDLHLRGSLDALQPEGGESGEGEEYFLTFRDVTDSVQAEERFRLALESSPNAVLVVNDEGGIDYANAMTQRFFGYAPEELRGKNLEILVPERFRAVHGGHFRGFLKSPRPRPMGPSAEVFGRHQDGSEFPVEISLGPFRAGGRTYVLAMVVNISERKSQEQRIQEQKGNLERSNHDLEAFAYAASHDLQEPLRAVNGFLQLLRKYAAEKLDEKALGYLDNASKGAVRMRSLTEGLLEYSRLGRSEILEWVDANAVLGVVLEDLKVALDEAGCRPAIEPLPRIRGNRVLLRQVFQNLMTNAIKFRSEAPLTLSVRTGERYGVPVILFSDNGIGIDPDFREKAFQLFQRGRAGKGTGGFGIGLAMVAKSVRLMGGSIDFVSEVGQGTTFYVTLETEGSSDRLTGETTPGVSS